MKTSKPVTLKDIAQRAGVSTNAVSKALRDCSDISDITKNKIKQLADELGYIPDTTAANLRKGNSNVIAIVFNNFYNPYFSIFCQKMCNSLKEKNYQYHLIYCNTFLLNMKDLENIMINKFCGIITFVEPTVEVADFFKKREIPFLLIGIHSNIPHLDCVYTDDIQGGKLVGEYFINNNYKNALYITNSISETSYRRFFGFYEVINNSGKNCDFIPYNPEEDIIKIAYNKIIKECKDFIFCFSDELAILLKNFLKKKNIKEKVTIFGYDSIHKYYSLIPNVNSVESNIDEIIEYSCEYIINKITNIIDINNYIDKKFPTYLHIIK